MSWTEVFPVFTDEQIEKALKEFSREDEALFQDEFGVERIVGRVGATGGHIVAFSLFCKPPNIADTGVKQISEDVLKNNDAKALGTRFEPWHHYVAPLIEHGPKIIEARPDVTVRIYLAKDMEFLLPELIPFAEIVLMRGSSVRSAPGMLWRFLPLEEGRALTVLDADLASTALLKIRITERLPEAGLGFWRVPVPFDFAGNGDLVYRTIAGCYWGARVMLPILDLLRAFRWHQNRNLHPVYGLHPLKKRYSVLFGCCWPNYGSDEYFQNVVLYPRFAEHGTLTILRKPTRSWFLLLDIEYVTWANSNSLVNYELYPHVAREGERDEDGKELTLTSEKYHKPNSVPPV